MKKARFRSTIVALFALAAAAVRTTARAQNYPNHSITAIVPFAGGSASDVVTRILLDRMSRSMGQPIIVENRPGAGGNIGTAAVARAEPDGYTLLGGGSGPVAANKSLYQHLGYDPETDFETISPFAAFTIVVVASKTLPVENLQELIAYAKARPGQLNYGSVGVGSSQHLAGEYFGQVTGVKSRTCPTATSRNRTGSDRRRGAARVPVVSERIVRAAGQGRQGAGGRRR